MSNTPPIEAIISEIEKAIRGKTRIVRQVVTAWLAGGHVLLEDIPGVGKTTLARALAKVVGGTFRRVQFTSDLLPSDILGVSIYRKKSETFEFQKGPLFANVVLADELNRTTPRTQSALLEAMSEKQISMDNQTYPLELPFFVIATQNPLEQFGTYPLPESQLDRFLMRLEMGYPGPEVERSILLAANAQDPIASLSPLLTSEQARALQQQVDQVKFAEPLVDYALRIIEKTRNHPEIKIGVSPRGAISWARAAKASATVDGRDFVTPDDIKETAVPCLGHRIHVSSHVQGATLSQEGIRLVESIVAQTEAPR